MQKHRKEIEPLIFYLFFGNLSVFLYAEGVNEIKTVELGSELYPKLLAEEMGVPEILYIRGNVELLSKEMVCVVGSRKMSRKGKENTELLVGELVRQGKVVVSGLAYGVDSEAQRVAIEKGGEVVVVLAHGLDMIYPKENENLAKKILQKGGVWVSEWEEGIKPEAEYFVARNRIMVGMSQAVFIVEAEINSGSTSSATWAAEMGREVWAIPGSSGCGRLIEQGVNALRI